MGLGLSIVDRLAKSLEISLQIDSEVGVGTSFSLKLAKIEPERISVPRSGVASSLSGFQIVILHSTPASCTQLKETLEQWGAMAMGWSDLDTADSYTSSHAWQPDMIVASQDLYENLLDIKSRAEAGNQFSHSDNYQRKSKLGILGADFSNLPILVLHSPGRTSAAPTSSSERVGNSKHHWFEDPINPSVLRSFIQRLVVSPAS